MKKKLVQFYSHQIASPCNQIYSHSFMKYIKFFLTYSYPRDRFIDLLYQCVVKSIVKSIGWCICLSVLLLNHPLILWWRVKSYSYRFYFGKVLLILGVLSIQFIINSIYSI